MYSKLPQPVLAQFCFPTFLPFYYQRSRVAAQAAPLNKRLQTEPRQVAHPVCCRWRSDWVIVFCRLHFYCPLMGLEWTGFHPSFTVIFILIYYVLQRASENGVRYRSLTVVLRVVYCFFAHHSQPTFCIFFCTLFFDSVFFFFFLFFPLFFICAGSTSRMFESIFVCVSCAVCVLVLGGTFSPSPHALHRS